MAHGTKPYGHTTAQNIVYGVQDMGELAARLGSIDTFERRGNVICFDGFEGGLLLWTPDTDGGLDSAARLIASPRMALQGAFSVRLTAGNTIGDYAGIIRYLAYPVLGAFGFECAFMVSATPQFIQLHANLYDGTNRGYGYLSYDCLTGWLWYFDGVTGLQVVGNKAIWPNGFNILKMVIDYANGRYVRVFLNDEEYDLSTRTIAVNPSALARHLRVSIVSITVNAAVLSNSHIDNVIVTQNEPP